MYSFIRIIVTTVLTASYHCSAFAEQPVWEHKEAGALIRQVVGSTIEAASKGPGHTLNKTIQLTRGLPETRGEIFSLAKEALSSTVTELAQRERIFATMVLLAEAEDLPGAIEEIDTVFSSWHSPIRTTRLQKEFRGFVQSSRFQNQFQSESMCGDEVRMDQTGFQHIPVLNQQSGNCYAAASANLLNYARIQRSEQEYFENGPMSYNWSSVIYSVLHERQNFTNTPLNIQGGYGFPLFSILADIGGCGNFLDMLGPEALVSAVDEGVELIRKAGLVILHIEDAAHREGVTELEAIIKVLERVEDGSFKIVTKSELKNIVAQYNHSDEIQNMSGRKFFNSSLKPEWVLGALSNIRASGLKIAGKYIYHDQDSTFSAIAAITTRDFALKSIANNLCQAVPFKNTSGLLPGFHFNGPNNLSAIKGELIYSFDRSETASYDSPEIAPFGAEDRWHQFNEVINVLETIRPIDFSYCANSVIQQSSKLYDASYEPYEIVSQKSGQILVDNEICGHHASLVIGKRYNRALRRCEFLVRNSWGRDYRYSVETNGFNDFWTPAKDFLNKSTGAYTYKLLETEEL